LCITDPDGTAWTVRRRLFKRPRWSRFRADSDSVTDGAASALPDAALQGVGEAGLAGLVVGIVLVVVFAVVVLLVWPLVLLAAELVVALALIGVRLALGRWIVVAESDRGRRLWHVKGSREAKDLVREVARAIATGGPLPMGYTLG
jgi:hypothetical protein